jgi:haloacetate dehalogenase
MFEGFSRHRIEANGASINVLVGGKGPPLLLLHGYPQTHVMWHRIAPRLVDRFTIVAPDLRGYGDSSKPAGGAGDEAYAKRTMAADQVAVMRALGFQHFAVAGHDRGGRVAHRLCLDHPDAVTHAALLDIVPTATAYARTDKAFATAYFHWFFLIQPYDFPERMIAADPDLFLMRMLSGLKAPPDAFTPEALAEYKRCFRDPATIHATCEDYRAAATIDLEHDTADAGARIRCPLLALWGERGVVGRLYDPLALWREKAAAPSDVQGRALPCAHFLAEEAPDETEAALTAFFAA